MPIYLHLILVGEYFVLFQTPFVTYWLQRPPHEVVGSIPGCDRPKSLKLVVAAFPLGAQDHGNSTTTGPQVSG